MQEVICSVYLDTLCHICNALRLLATGLANQKMTLNITSDVLLLTSSYEILHTLLLVMLNTVLYWPFVNMYQTCIHLCICGYLGPRSVYKEK